MIILDTNVISELMRIDADSSVLDWAGQNLSEEFTTTAISKAEILYGLCLMAKGQKRAKLEAAAEQIFLINLGGRVISFDSDAAEIYATIGASRRHAGRPISESDCQIAAVARLHLATLATRNTRDFEGCGVKLINPWKR